MSAALYETLTQLPDLPNAACREHDPDLWDDTPPDMSRAKRASQVRHAKQVCNLCPEMNACLEYALSAQVRAGIWGGMTTDERIDLIRSEPLRPTARYCPRGRHALPKGATRCLKCDIAASKKRDRDLRHREKVKKAPPVPRKPRCPQCRITKHKCTHPVDGAV
jgi:WhiB family redox-sensing transcriptional regulator